MSHPTTNTDARHELYTIRLLILENEPQDADLMLLALKRAGFHCDWVLASNEAEFRAALSNSYDIILADYSLAQYTADQALDLLHESGMDVPLIVVTGSVGEETAAACMKRGAADYLLKDRLGRLGEAVRHAIEERQLHREREHTRRELQIKDWALASSVTPFALADLDGTMTYVNPAFLDLWGYDSVDQVSGRKAGSFLIGIDSQELLDLLLSNGSWRGEVTIRCRGGEHRIVDLFTSTVRDEQGNPIHLMASCVDITDQKQADFALRQSESRVRTIIDTVLDGIVISDENGIIEMINPSVTRMFGYSPDEVLGKNVKILMISSDRDLHQGYIRDYLRTGEQRMIGVGREVMGQRKDNSLFPLELALSEIWLNHQRFFVGMLHDLTEHNQAEEARRAADVLRLKLEKANELREFKSRFISMVTHEFKNPLAGIQLTVNSLQNYSERMTPQQRLQKLQMILEQVQHMNNLLEDVLSVGQSEASTLIFNPVMLDFREFCRAIFEEMRATVGRNHELVFKATPDELPTEFDPKLMRQMVNNLLSNAIKYSPEGSTVQMEISSQQQNAVLEIVDSGIGIPDSDQKQIFEAFHRAKNAHRLPGTGLGLAIAKQVVELHGGSITFESEVNMGTTFVVSLPCGQR